MSRKSTRKRGRHGPAPRSATPKKTTRTNGRSKSLVLVAGALVGVLAVSAVALALMRTGDAPSSPASQDTSGEPGPVHVHGLGINPADGSLLIATHTGTYAVAAEEKRAHRIGDGFQDTMGFTVVGPDHFLGSGHPDVQGATEQNLPPHLGLIESRDGGETWQSVSLLGEADFHVLRVAEQRIYGYDASNDRLLVSRDGGRRWRELNRPAPLLDLAVDGADPLHLVASGQGGLYASVNEGRTWRLIARRLGFLAWPADDRLYLVDGRGAVVRSADAGRTWVRVGDVGGEPGAFLAVTARELYVALHDGTILQSRDGGRSWTTRSGP